MIEPAAYGASVLFGPHTQNFRTTVEQLRECGGAREVGDARCLTDALHEALQDPEAAAGRGQAARQFVLAQQGATERTLSELDRLFEPLEAA
jgi:3-deoxy-D-manno-octulosonic-acid transferase